MSSTVIYILGTLQSICAGIRVFLGMVSSLDILIAGGGRNVAAALVELVQFLELFRFATCWHFHVFVAIKLTMRSFLAGNVVEATFLGIGFHICYWSLFIFRMTRGLVGISRSS